MSAARTLLLPPWVDRLDAVVDRAWEPLRGRSLPDTVFYAASAAGDFSVIWHGLNLARLAGGTVDRKEFSRFAVALGIESLLVNQVIKRLFNRGRPTPDPERAHLLRTPSTSSFPSGHASSAAMASSMLARAGPGRVLYRTIAAVVATSRIHVRIHHASDVIAGTIIGGAFARIASKVVTGAR